MTAFRISRRTHQFSPTLFFVLVSAVPAEGTYAAEDILIHTGNAFSRDEARAMEKRFEEALAREIRARGGAIAER